jgi:putative ABC transport system permease protein
MFRNYIRSAFRAIRQSSRFGLLNIAGLALGIACTTLIFLWIEDEFSFDRQYAKRDQLYMIRMNLDYSNMIETTNGVPWRLTAVTRASIPEVVNTTRIAFDDQLFALGSKSIYESGLCVSYRMSVELDIH